MLLKTLEYNGKLIYVSSVDVIGSNKTKMVQGTNNFKNDVYGLYAKTKKSATLLVKDYVKKYKLNAIIECAKSDYTNKDYILSGKNYSIKEIDEYISLYTGGRKVFVYIPLWIMNMFYPICNFMYFVVGKKPPFTKVMIKKLKDNLSFSNLLAKKEIGYSNRDIRNTLFDILNF